MQGCPKDLWATAEQPAHWPGLKAGRGRVAAIPPLLRRNPSRLASPSGSAPNPASSIPSPGRSYPRAVSHRLPPVSLSLLSLPSGCEPPPAPYQLLPFPSVTLPPPAGRPRASGSLARVSIS